MYLFLLIFFTSGMALASDMQSPRFELDFHLVDPSLVFLDQTKPAKMRQEALDKYLADPLIKFAFQKYSHPKRPPDNRLNQKEYTEFVEQLWVGKADHISHKRLKYVLPHYQWALKNIGDVKKDVAIVKSRIEIWMKQALTKIPFGTPAAVINKVPIKMVFLADPGGSYPWVAEDDKYKYIYFDILQFRGFTPESRAKPLNEKAFMGFLIHEFYHQFQNDKFEVKDKADWLLAAAVGEGSAMLIGNNAPNSQGKRLFEKEEPLLTGKAWKEWSSKIQDTPKKIKDFIKQYQLWKTIAPTQDDYYKIISDDSWVATPKNGLLFGEVYRVGAEMLLSIKLKLGQKKFYEVLGNSGLLIDYWENAESKTTKL